MCWKQDNSKVKLSLLTKLLKSAADWLKMQNVFNNCFALWGRSIRKNKTKIVLKYSEGEKGTENSPRYAALFSWRKKQAKKPKERCKFHFCQGIDYLITMLITSQTLFLLLPLHLDWHLSWCIWTPANRLGCCSHLGVPVLLWVPFTQYYKQKLGFVS